MLELGVSQAQAQFTKLLNKKVMIIDKKTNIKKAVILPYDEYMQLIAKTKSKKKVKNGIFNKYIGILDKDFKSDDEKYNRILNWKYL